MAVTKATKQTSVSSTSGHLAPKLTPAKKSARKAQLARTRRALEQKLTADELSSARPSNPESNKIKQFAASQGTSSAAVKAQGKGQLGLLLTKGVNSGLGSAAAGAVPLRSVSGGARPDAVPQSSSSAQDETPPGYDGNTSISLGEAAEIFQKHLDILDTAAGGWWRDGKFGLKDLEAVAADPSAPRELREAAQQVLADPNMLNALDVAGGPKVDRVFSNKDLERVIAEERENPDGPTLDQAVDVLRQEENFKLLDAAATGEEDGKISRQDLEIIASDPSVSEELRTAAQAVLDNDNLFNAMDVGSDDRRDGFITMSDLKNINYSPTPEAGRQWSWGDELALRRSLKDGVNFDDDLYGGIHQTDRGNCVSTAIIKAAMDRYGNDVFESVTRTRDGGYDVTLKDGSEVHITREELEAAATGAHFEGDSPEATSFATLCYAVMAKRAQQLGHEGSQTYAEALRALANGENPMDTVKFLGLQDQVRTIDVDDIPGHTSGVVAWGHGHAVYVDTRDGETYTDAWGNQNEYDGTNQTGKDEADLEHAFYFA